jgi:ADP-dependent NAD(P)H-hydrate dehydratase / NAD(P)H-hydrate epimerase
MQPMQIEAGPAMVKALRKDASGHKFSNGAASVLTGGAGLGGAARLAAWAALRIGAALAENAARL